MSMSEAHFRVAAEHAQRILQQLIDLRFDYQKSALPEQIKRARVEALDSKIDALRSIQFDSKAHPWAGDE